MSRNMSKAAAEGSRRRSRRTSFILMAVSAIVVIALLVNEQVALLYILATVGIAVLLAVVALSDLQGSRQTTAQQQQAPFDDAATIGDGITQPPASSYGRSAARPAKSKPRA